MVLGESIEVRAEGLTAAGTAIGRFEGKAVFIDGAAPEETVVCRVTEEKPRFLRAAVVEVIERSPFRIAAPCPLFGVCGGCAFQHIEYRAQLAQKETMLAESFARIGGYSALPPVRVEASKPYGYRNRMQFHRTAATSRTTPLVGLKMRTGTSIVPIGDCPIAVDGIRRALEEGSLSAPPWTDRFTVFSHDNLVLVEGGPAERGKLKIADREITLDVRGFFQSNIALLAPLARAVLDAAEGVDAAVDLYCGVGTFGAFLVDRFERLDLVERDSRSIGIAAENVRGPRVRRFALSDDQWARGREGAERRYDFAVVDPPRVGLSPALKEWLRARRPRVLAYIACDPATQARDAKELAGAGYSLTSLSLFDFYPQTPHIESLAVFRCD